MRDGRLRRFIGGLSLGYIQMAATIVTGLWMTPFLLRQLGSHDYGLWLLGTQVLTYLALMDLGVVALIPREVAATAGRVDTDRANLQDLVGQTAKLVMWQLPAVAIAGAIVIWLMPSEWIALRWPMSFVVLTFVATFPLRIFAALLQGLQDLTFLGIVQFSSWGAGVVVTFLAAFMGFGLYALAMGWITTQIVTVAFGWRRLRRMFPDVVPASLPALSLSSAWHQLSRGAWISVNQVAQVLLVGTDLVVVGKLLGPEAVVPFACTGRLANMLANQPQMFMQMALPALSSLRASAPREQLFDVAKSMAQVMLLLSGAIVAVVLAVNGPFVAWWVGESRFGGVGLTALLLAGMLVRHVNVTAIYTLFCFGNERRLALTSIADGLVGLVSMIVLVPMLGLYGAALGPLIGTCVVSLPNNFAALGRELGASPIEFLRPLRPWLMRFPAIVAVIVLFAYAWDAHGLWRFAPLAGIVGLAYAAAMVPAVRTPPLGDLIRERVYPALSKITGLSYVVSVSTKLGTSGVGGRTVSGPAER
jgi:O-antigen/teichoic acid export membrane protein